MFFGKNKNLKAAQDSSTPDYLLSRYIIDGSDKVKIAVAENKNVQRHTILELAQNENPQIRQAVARNPLKMTAEIWDKLYNDIDENVKNELLKHYPNKPEQHDRRS